MELLKQILIPAFWFVVLGGAIGCLLAVASKFFTVKVDEKIEQIKAHLPGANCGGCGYTSCETLAEAISKGEAKPTACTATGIESAKEIGQITGAEVENTVRMRAQVMCSGTVSHSKKKYIYGGIPDCIAAARLGGGDKLCANGCTGLGTCVESCQFGAIKVENGVAVVDYSKCAGCGVCVRACPKHIIKLIPFDSYHWVGCMSVENGKTTRGYCDVGCISCRICEKVCPEKAITVNDFVAAIDYSKCTGCDMCTSKCPRKIIWSAHTQKKHGLIITRVDEETLDFNHE